MRYKKRRVITSLLIALVALFLGGYSAHQEKMAQQEVASGPKVQSSATSNSSVLALDALEQLAIKGRAPKTNYAREQFSDGWAEVDACDMRNYILHRDLTQVVVDESDQCTVLKGVLEDKYTGESIHFARGARSSSAVQIDHIVALSDAWQKGAQDIDVSLRAEFANDPLNLMAVDGPANNQKRDSDAASWLPPNKSYRCQYIARQIAVKKKYTLWVTQAEHDSMKKVLQSCPEQKLPAVQ